SFYDLNLTKMIKIINYLRGVTSIDKALEETDNDIYTQYSREEDFGEIILECLEFPDQEEHVELTKQTIEEFRKKAEAQGLFNISTNKGKELWKEPIKNARYCNGECNSIFSEDNHIYFETNNQEAYCEYCYFTEVRQFTKCTTCQSWCQSPEEKENRRCQECTQIGTSKFIEKIEEIEWRQEIKNLKRTSTRVAYHNTYLQTIEDQYINLDKSVLHQRELELQQEISDMEDLPLPNEEEAFENAIQQKQELLTVPQLT
ncbi:4114_t:CDS:2, partial [Gigaspora rosea]